MYGNWADISGDEECITDQVRNGYSLREAASLCDTLKIAVAGPEGGRAERCGADGDGGDEPFDG